MTEEMKSLGMEPVPTSELTQGPSCPSGASPELDCPALHEQSEHYPASWHGRVPKTIRMAKRVTADLLEYLPENRDMIAEARVTYPAHTNKHGAVSAILPNGKQLGVKPYEFEVVEWYANPKPTSTPHTVPLECQQHSFSTEREFRDALSSLYEEWRKRSHPEDAHEDFDEWKIAEITRLRLTARHSPGWVKIEEGKPETLPPIRERWDKYQSSGYILIWDGHNIIKSEYYGNNRWADDGGGILRNPVTHWQPLPAHPRLDDQQVSEQLDHESESKKNEAGLLPAPPSEGETRK